MGIRFCMFSFIADWCFERLDDGPEDMNEDAPEDLTPSSREADRKRLQAEVDEYLKSGGVIRQIKKSEPKGPKKLATKTHIKNATKTRERTYRQRALKNAKTNDSDN